MKSTFAFFLCILFYSVLHSQLTFQEITDSLEVSHNYGGVSEISGGMSFVDFNRDGFDDLSFATTSGLPLHFYLNNGQGFFEEITLPAVEDLGNVKHILWADIDNDGDYDLLTTANDTGNHLYENTGNLTLVDITESAGLEATDDEYNSFGAVLSDFNQDGFLDIYVVNRTLNGFYLPNANLLYENNGDNTFTDKTIVTNTGDPDQAPFCAISFDYNKDGYEDVYIGQDKAYGNTLLQGNFTGEFTNVSESSGALIYMDAMNADVGDLDNDGYLDIYLTNVSEGAVLLMNNSGTAFTDEAEERGVNMQGEAGWSASIMDIDNDLDLDVWVAASSFSSAYKDKLYYNNGNGFFQEATENNGLYENPHDFTVGNGFGDFNNDGFPDLGVNSYDDTSRIWLNNGNDNNWISYQLEGTVSNRDGVGCYLTFYLDGISYLRSTHIGQAFLGQQSFRKIFGIADKSKVDSLDILWPSGHVDHYYQLIPSNHYNFIEGETLASEIQSANGFEICASDSTELSFTGDFNTIIWNGNLEQTSYWAVAGETVQAELNYSAGLTQLYDIEISVSDENLNLAQIPSGFVCNQLDSVEISANLETEFPVELYWNDEIGGTSAYLSVGSHSLLIEDVNGCSRQVDFSVELFPEAELEITTENNLCFGESEGSLLVSSNIALDSIAVNDQVSGGLALGLSADSYDIYISDENGCSYQEVVEITEPEQISAEISAILPDYGSADGQVDFSISGGTSPYYVNGSELNTITDLTQGDYSAQVCDVNDCCLTVDFTIDLEVGISDLTHYEQLIFPNPVEDRLYLKNFDLNISELNIYDVGGRLVKQVVVTRDESLAFINVSELTAGTYLLRDKYNVVSLEFVKN